MKAKFAAQFFAELEERLREKILSLNREYSADSTFEKERILLLLSTFGKIAFECMNYFYYYYTFTRLFDRRLLGGSCGTLFQKVRAPGDELQKISSRKLDSRLISNSLLVLGIFLFLRFTNFHSYSITRW